MDPFLAPKGLQSFKRGLAAYFLGLACRRVLFANCWAPFRSLSGPISSKKGDLHDPTFHFSAAGPRQRLGSSKKGVPRNLTSDLLPFPAAGPLFVASAARVPRNLTADLFPFPAAGPLFVPSAAWILQKWAGHWCHLCCFRSRLFESLAAQRGCTWVTSLCSFFCSWPLLSVWHLLY